MAASLKARVFSSGSSGTGSGESEEEGGASVTAFHLLRGKTREKIVLQRLIVVSRLPRHLDDRTELGAHYEKLSFHLSKVFMWGHMTGLLLIYPSCLLHVIESSREVLVALLKDLTDMQQPDCCLLEDSKMVFMAHGPQNRLFQQWSYKVLKVQEVTDAEKLGEEEISTVALVCSVLSALQKLSVHLEASKAPPGSVLDKNQELIVPQEVLKQLLTREELQNPQQHLQTYSSPLNISMDFGRVLPRSTCLTTV
ncbi:testis-expressed protein 47 [Aulostomus maculatus]